MLRKAVDDTIALRGQAFVKTVGLKRVANPLTELQNLATESPEFDGVLFTKLRYRWDGKLELDGFVGTPVMLRPRRHLLSASKQIPNLLRAEDDPHTTLDLSLRDMKPQVQFASNGFWPLMIENCQVDLATSPETFFLCTHLGRAYFKYVDTKSADKDAQSRRLSLHYTATYLAAP